MNKTTHEILLLYIGYNMGDEKDTGKKQLQLGQLYLATILKQHSDFHLYLDINSASGIITL